MTHRLIGVSLLIGLALLIVACQPTSDVPVEPQPPAADGEAATSTGVEADPPTEVAQATVPPEEPTAPPAPTASPAPTATEEELDQSAVRSIISAVAKTYRAEQRAPTFRSTEEPGPVDESEPESLADYLPVLGAAPEITNESWINTDEPLRLEDLEGQVVLIEFWTFG